MSFIEKASKSLGYDGRNGRPCTRMTNVLLCMGGITRTQLRFCGGGVIEKRLKQGKIAQECGGFSVSDSKPLKAKLARRLTSCILVYTSNSFSISHTDNENDVFLNVMLL